MKAVNGIGVVLGALFGIASAIGLGTPKRSAREPKPGPDGLTFSIDTEHLSTRYFRIDSFSIPQEARPEFEAAMRRNMAFIKTLPGFLGHVAFEKAGGPTTFNIVTIAQWESKEAVDKAGESVRAYYKKIGFDMPAMLARWGVKMERGEFMASRELQD